MNSERINRMESLLKTAFAPDSLLIKDQSHLHAGHAGAREGLGHFEVQIIATAFAGKSRIATHQMIYAALGDMMTTDIHALSIKASATT